MKKIKKYIDENKILLFIILCISLVLLAIYFRFLNINYKSTDYTQYLSKWWEAIETRGIQEALKMNIGNYTEFYKIVLSIRCVYYRRCIIIYKIIYNGI